ncbi:MAG TPA: hypothetical protein VEZ40_19085 [Pyrinomonadaceae bacterium]|nr:hypothetical protein [Pyrinomonadaceae bacterium]
MSESKEVAATLERAGFAVVPGVIDERGIARALSAPERAEHSSAPARHLRRGGNDGVVVVVYAVRNLLDAVPELRELIDATRAPERRRRVVHPEFAGGELPAGLEWSSGARAPGR